MPGNFLNKIATKVISFAVRKYIEPYGELENLLIDNETKEILASLQLKGELQSIEIKMLQYGFIRDNEKNYLIFSDLYTSREWLNVILLNYFEEKPDAKKIEIPPAVATLLKFLL
ncbi:MAG: hypothetical protein LC102_04480 [Ignavibacteriales bacterium]|nr:MAG: hypothetical protein F9K26_10225 [Ignavibacteriaceae bacterium]MBW7874290.1 hypothetical protein [Ignavibacteria bacterium]MCZ2142666.1 hypothetical protein [Ignavibacteriales bacterium]OQY73477.1 MAG: hypothetical protein B6D45_08125 [Ignavibacteriales bacterium UTCHB3]MBV6443764.1 hypothetical protein [Ignavibacteriaceae bacterium]